MPRSFLVRKVPPRCYTRNPAQPPASVPPHGHSESATGQANRTDSVADQRPSTPADNTMGTSDAERRGFSNIPVSMVMNGHHLLSPNKGGTDSPTDLTKHIFNGIFKTFNGKIFSSHDLLNGAETIKSIATNDPLSTQPWSHNPYLHERAADQKTHPRLDSSQLQEAHHAQVIREASINSRSHSELILNGVVNGLLHYRSDLRPLRETLQDQVIREASINSRSHSELSINNVVTELRRNSGETSPCLPSHSECNLTGVTKLQKNHRASNSSLPSHSDMNFTDMTKLQMNNKDPSPYQEGSLDSITPPPPIHLHPSHDPTPSPPSSPHPLELDPPNGSSTEGNRLGTTVGYTYETFMSSDGRSKRKLLSSAAESDGDGHQRQTRYRCVDCGRHYATSSNLSRHRQTHRSLDSQHAKQCPHCRKVYVSMPALAMHVLTHDLKYRCSVCAKAFSRPWLLRGHLRSHTGEKPFGCAHCGKAFADRSNLRAHMQTHSALKHFRCQRCDRSLGLRSRPGQRPGQKLGHIIVGDSRTVVDEETSSSLTSCPTI